MNGETRKTGRAETQPERFRVLAFLCWRVTPVLLIGGFLSACGSPEPASAPASRSVQPPPAAASASPPAGAPAAELVDPAHLQVFLPDVAGWTRSTPENGRLNSPIPLSQSSAVYTKGAASVDFKIIDAGGNQRLFAPFGSLMTAGSGSETKDGFARGVSVEGYPAWEKWDAGTRNGEIGVAIERRFLVQLEGRRVQSIDALRGILDAADIGRLAAVR